MNYIIKFLIAIVVVVKSTWLVGQDNFVKTIDREETRSAWQLTEYQDRLFLRCTGVCNNFQECTEIMEINYHGDIVWSKRIPWLDGSSQTLLVNNDTIIMVGNEDITQESFFIHKMTLDGDSITTYNIDDEFSNIFIQNVTLYNEHLIVTGSGILNDSISALLYVVNMDGTLDTLIQSARTTERAVIWDALVDQQNRLNVFIDYKVAFIVDRTRIVKKYDSDFNEVFSYTSDPEDKNDDVPFATELQDGRIAYITGHLITIGDFDWSVRSLASIRALNEDGSIDWQFNYDNEPSWSRELLSITTLSNGDILATGRYSTRATDPVIEDVPFMLRITSEGEFLWERAYYVLDDEGEFKIGFLFDAIELDNGSLMAVGYIRNENNDILIMKTDSEGCVIESCETVSEIVDVEDHQAEIAGVIMYPNPVNYDKIIINIPSDIRGVLGIYDAAGSRVLSKEIIGGNNNINVSQLSKGIYFTSILSDSGEVWREKLVRL